MELLTLNIFAATSEKSESTNISIAETIVGSITDFNFDLPSNLSFKVWFRCHEDLFKKKLLKICSLSLDSKREVTAHVALGA